MILHPQDEIRYVPESDRELPEDEQTVFVFRPLTVRVERMIGRAQQRGDFIDADLLRFLLSGVERLRIEQNGDEPTTVEFKFEADGSVAEASIDMLDPPIRRELLRKVKEITGVTEEEEKNFSASLKRILELLPQKSDSE